MKIILIAGISLLSVFAANAQVNYSGGLYTQNFNNLSQDTYNPGSAIPLVLPSNSVTWADNTTVTGWYANQDTYTTAPTLLGLSLLNQLTSSGTGSDRALGSYLGTVAALNPITYGVRIKNTTGGTLQSFSLAYTAEEFTKGVGSVVAVDLLDSFNISYSTNASDVSGGGATNYNVINGSGNLANLNLLSSTTDTSRVQFTINNLNLANNGELWIRFERTGLLGITDNAVSIDDVSFSASAVPEPSTYMLIFLGIVALVVCRRYQPAAKKTTLTEGKTKVVALAAVLSLSGMTAVKAEESFTLKTDSKNNIVLQSEGKETGISKRTLRETYSGSWGNCTISRGTDSDGFDMLIVTIGAKSKVSSFKFNNSVVQSPVGQATVIYPNGTGAAIQMNSLGGSLQEADFAHDKYYPESGAKKPGHETCKYKAQPESVIMEDDFNWIYGDSVQNRETFVISSANCLKMIDNYVIAMKEEPPQSIWIRNESYIQRKTASAPGLPNSDQIANINIPLAPITRPDQLMPVLRARDLFNNMSVKQYRGILASMMPEIEKSSKQINELLAKWDKGNISKEELQTIQNAAKVVWMIRCDLVEGKRPDSYAIGTRYFGQPNLTLAGEATTPF